ncbi:MAG: topoisomerase protein [Candidatus Magasanikbacteria bacterium GW2011_GWC2_40_17]|uniref:DNA topoisomerase 1 n=1 Tax=Candidatus Magasanikbacteria bacterium GW2011_GWA2_42_32 TaxID=1619039 RepID=A0A0G1A6V4_9BACT|nr:MAG: topoisomerase protein [Candidatus Magasanikbacteria bacterium GW2011_GWC2_40_17]KKS56767.1 MAG: topoisomerase protein [Candidatus Magasanikbacteria bacterium GW2011_GWA2_42_32]OGH86044.1 MAG: DNA topoisomerase I [Candidatus Magasanikbacteria bacterium RIFOXYB2_FULL_38_10]
MSQLLIVESPTKAKTISKFLGTKFVVKSSFGHIRDLPKSELGVDVENKFEPHYVIPKDKQKIVTDLKKSAKGADEVLLATDEDREGEAISWHLANILDIPAEKVKRLVFHEITKTAIDEALKNPRPLDLNLVNAQQARRILDRLVGYKLSPFLWKKVARGLSAGRVQSVAVRLIVEREREIQAFKPEEYWIVEAVFEKNKENFDAKLHKIDGKNLEKLEIKNKEEADKILKELEDAKYQVASITKKILKKRAAAPFTTSTLQQEANRRLGFSAKQTMMLAQQLYEGIDLKGQGHVGLITYMRTDSVILSGKFLSDVREVIKNKFGEKYLPEKPNFYSTKSKLAQEAHEAIRPTEAVRDPASLKDVLEPRLWKLYDLIWKRAVASQMPEAIFNGTTVDIENQNQKYTFRATGNIITFPGYMALYPDAQKETLLPELAEKDVLPLVELNNEQHFTEPPARYNDAGLVKIMEEYGIGRPSTYAPTISTIIARKYVERDEKKRFKPTDIGFLVNDILVAHFPQITDYEFTAKMEDNFDTVAQGQDNWRDIIANFYEPFAKNLEEKTQELSKKELTEEATEEICEKCGSPMIIKIGRFGKFMACSNYPTCKNTKPLGEEKDLPPIDEKCPECGSPLMRRRGRFGLFISCSDYPKCKYIKKEVKSTGVKCPKCEKGDIIERRTRAKRIFFSCSRYPDCDFALWNKPTGEKCEVCESLMVEGAKEKIVCSNKECPSNANVKAKSKKKK